MRRLRSQRRDPGRRAPASQQDGARARGARGPQRVPSMSPLMDGQCDDCASLAVLCSRSSENVCRLSFIGTVSLPLQAIHPSSRPFPLHIHAGRLSPICPSILLRARVPAPPPSYTPAQRLEPVEGIYERK